MKTLCVILARAGSKGLPGKNTRVVSGKPLVTWTMEYAKQATCIDRLVLSTDGDELANIAEGHGLDVVMRPAELASDTATVDSAVRHAVKHVENQENTTFDTVVILYGNVPVRPASLVDKSIEKLEATQADSVQSVCPVGKFHPYWMKTLGGDGGDVLTHYQPNEVYRRQDLPPVYQLDGGIIAVTRESLFNVIEGQPHAFLGDDRRAVVTEPGDVVDVDTEIDLVLAETRLNQSKTASLCGTNEGRDEGRKEGRKS